MKQILSLVILFYLGALSLSYAGEIENDADKYQKCMSLVDSDPNAALAFVQGWIFSETDIISNNIPAGHCKALSYLALDRAVEAAELLEQLVDDMTIEDNSASLSPFNDPMLKVELYAQAALSWKEAGKLDKAYDAFGAALSSIVQNSLLQDNHAILYDLFLERGTVQILRSQYKAAIEDFTLALEQDQTQFEAFLQRAKAYRKRRDYLAARLDLNMAIELSENNPDILLESGIVFREQNKILEAAAEWQRILDIYPDSDTAKLAETNLKLLKIE
ncbi:MAG: hypothetical protein K9G26_00315 [Emcibacter sp.]|nr:hypothetical protein [Emcibacter sp.]